MIGVTCISNTFLHMSVSLNGGTLKSSILIGFSIINHPFWGYHYFWETPIYIYICIYIYRYSKDSLGNMDPPQTFGGLRTPTDPWNQLMSPLQLDRLPRPNNRYKKVTRHSCTAWVGSNQPRTPQNSYFLYFSL